MEKYGLKPCPFCGAEAMTCYNTMYGFQVYCTNEKCFMAENIMYGMKTEEMAVEAWNKRKPPCGEAEKTNSGCLGYGKGPSDDEPIDACKNCPKYVSYGIE